MPDTLRLYIVRHGVTDWNQQARFQGQSDIPLNAEGEAQAKRIADRLASIERPPMAVFSSDLSRASATAEAIATPLSLNIQKTPLLRELMLGHWEGLNREEIEARGEGELLRRYRSSPNEQTPPGGEALRDAAGRILSVLQHIREAYPIGEVAVVGHGGTLRALFHEALNTPLESMLNFTLENASLSIIDYANVPHIRDRRVLLVNDTSHLHKPIY